MQGVCGGQQGHEPALLRLTLEDGELFAVRSGAELPGLTRKISQLPISLERSKTQEVCSVYLRTAEYLTPMTTARVRLVAAMEMMPRYFEPEVVAVS